MIVVSMSLSVANPSESGPETGKFREIKSGG